MKIIKRIIIGIIIVILLVALAGIYKFNFTNDDIYIQQENGSVIKYDELNQ